MIQLQFDTSDGSFERAISPFQEMIAYEILWKERNTTFKKLAETFQKNSNILPSELIYNEDKKNIQIIKRNILDILTKKLETNLGIVIKGTIDYPAKLKDAKYPIELFYYQGNLELLNTRSVSVVGARKVSEEGRKRAARLVKYFVEDDFTIVSGLAEGVDTVSHQTAIKYGGRTIGVIGTPLSSFYPRENKLLQEFISKNHLLISQVPFIRYENQDYRMNRLFFPERNVTMSAITEATVIVEASDTSGTLIQARAALQQKRKLFILDSCFKNPSISWPSKYEKKGAIRVRDYEDIKQHLLP